MFTFMNTRLDLLKLELLRRYKSTVNRGAGDDKPPLSDPREELGMMKYSRLCGLRQRHPLRDFKQASVGDI